MTEPLLSGSDIGATNQVVHLEDAHMLRRERMELVTEGTTAFTLLSAANTSYTAGDTDVFVFLSALAGAALVVAVVIGARNILRGRAVSARVNVVGVLGGLAGVVEGLHRLYSAQFTFGHKHFALGVLTLLAGVMTTTIALLMERLEHRRALSITDAGIRMRLNRIRRFKVAWGDVSEIRINADDARIVHRTGRDRVIPLKRLINRDEVATAIRAAAAARSISVLG